VEVEIFYSVNGDFCTRVVAIIYVWETTTWWFYPELAPMPRSLAECGKQPSGAPLDSISPICGGRYRWCEYHPYICDEVYIGKLCSRKHFLQQSSLNCCNPIIFHELLRWSNVMLHIQFSTTSFMGWSGTESTVTDATTGLLYQPWMISV
jgi:hypothetical protein